MSAVDPRDERFLLFLREAARFEAQPKPTTAGAEMATPERIVRLGLAMRGLGDAVGRRLPPPDVFPWSVQVAGWALSPDPEALEAWCLEALYRLRRDRIRARNVTRGVVDWTLGQLRARVADLRTSWQAVHDAGLHYPVDSDRPLSHPALSSAETTVWSYALIRAVVAQHHRGLGEAATTLDDARRLGAGARPGPSGRDSE